jgi:cell division protein FtsB
LADGAGRRRIGRWVVLGGGCLLFLVLLFSGDQGLVRYARMKGYERELTGRIAALQSGNVALAAEVKRLEGDPALLEGLARTQLQMVRPGEVVYLLPAGSGSPAR